MVRSFAAGRVQSVGAAGELLVHPSVRWGGPPGCRSHTNTTPWALGLISTVRIGAGVWRKSQALNHAAAPVATLTLQSLDESLRPEEKGKSPS